MEEIMNHTYSTKYLRKLPKFTEKAVIDCVQGDILAADIFNSTGCKLLSANTVMNDYIKDHLNLNGFRHISIYSCGGQVEDSVSEIAINNHINTILCLKSVLLDVTVGRAPDFSGVRKIFRVVAEHSDNKNASCVINLAHQIRSVDSYTYAHSVHVAFYSMLLAIWLKFSDEDIALMFQAGLLHDIGKIKISQSILKKPGCLTTEEFDIIKTHTTLGYSLVDYPELDIRIKQAVLMHHERLNGSGYPLGIIPESTFARVVAIADVYDAMTSDRIYKKGVTQFKAFEFLLDEGLTLFDPHMVHIFIANMSAYLTGSQVLLADGETAVLVYIPPENPSGYILRIGSDIVDSLDQQIVAFTNETN